MSTGNVIPFRRKPVAVGTPVPGRQRSKVGLALALSARPGAVSIVIGDVELWLDPGQARELGNDLVELAADAEGGRRG